MFEYTEMSISHYDDAYKIWQESEGLYLTIGDTNDAVQKYLDRNPGMSFVCIDKENNRLVGTILCGHDGRRGFIYHLAVRKGYRGRSIGKTLIEKSLAKLKAGGIARCILFVKIDNKESAEYWVNLGWDKRNDLDMFSIDLQ
jgi:ribosomal protein S18 acetylase RimI-like enzyme